MNPNLEVGIGMIACLTNISRTSWSRLSAILLPMTICFGQSVWIGWEIISSLRPSSAMLTTQWILIVFCYSFQKRWSLGPPAGFPEWNARKYLLNDDEWFEVKSSCIKWCGGLDSYLHSDNGLSGSINCPYSFFPRSSHTYSTVVHCNCIPFLFIDRYKYSDFTWEMQVCDPVCVQCFMAVVVISLPI